MSKNHLLEGPGGRLKNWSFQQSIVLDFWVVLKSLPNRSDLVHSPNSFLVPRHRHQHAHLVTVPPTQPPSHGHPKTSRLTMWPIQNSHMRFAGRMLLCAAAAAAVASCGSGGGPPHRGLECINMAEVSTDDMRG